MGVDQLLQSLGYLGIFVSVFVESGIVIGLVLPLPGFSLLFAAGAFAATGRLDLALVLTVGFLASVGGYFAGYYSGRVYGRKLFYSPRVKQLKPEHVTQAEEFYKRHGYATLVVGRFVPFVHTIAPIIAGLTRMSLIPFTILNIVGAAIWTLTATLLGYYIGQAVPHAEYYIVVVAIVVAIAVNLPPVKKLVDRFSNYLQNM